MNLINLELTEMKAEELRIIAKEYEMDKSWKARKQEMIDFLEVIKNEQIKEKEQQEADELVDFINEELQTQLEKPKPIKPNSKIMREVILFDNEDNFVGEFANQKELVRFCMKENIANSGWCARSIRTTERFYMPNGEKSFSQKNKYTGIGFYAMKKQELIDQA